MSTAADLECRKVSPEWQSALSDFFSDLQAAGDSRYFHPHPFDSAEAARLCHYTGQDLYYLMLASGRVVAYGLLRGWDEGYEVPSLGIAVHPRERGKGIGLCMMHFLHSAARYRGAPRIRLKVYPENTGAVELYRKLGYEFSGKDRGQLVGILSFANRVQHPAQ